jgi:hypothetical protein
MKLNTPTVFLVGIAAILGIVVFADLQGGGPTDSAEESGQPLFDFTEEEVQSFTIENFQGTLAFERDDEGTWQMTEPEPFLASDASVAFLLNLLATGEGDRTLTVCPEEVGEFGLEPPQATVDIVLEDNTTHELYLGDFDFSQQSVYAQVDPEDADGSESAGSGEDASGGINVLLVSASLDTAINRPVEEWQQVEPPPESPPEESLESSPEEPSEASPELSPELSPEEPLEEPSSPSPNSTDGDESDPDEPES